MQKINVSRTQWKLIVWTPIFLGVIIFSVFASTFFIPKEYTRAVWFSSIGLLLVGWGFGLVYARAFKIKGLDN